MRVRRVWIVLVVSGIALAGLIAYILSSYRSDLAAAERRIASGSQVVNTPCGPVEYAVEGKGTPLLLVHGAGGGFDQGLDFGRGLADSGFMLIAVSRFGYLRTPLPADASPAAQADAHACLLDALALPKAAVLGGSAGAPSTIQFCLRHAARCSAMVLLVPALFPGPRAGEPTAKPPTPPSPVVNSILGSDFFYWLNLKLARDTMLERLFATPARDFRAAPAEEQERLLAAMRNALPMGPRRDGLWNDVAIVASGVRYPLERLGIPTLVIGVEDDLFGIHEGGRDAARRIPGARWVSFPTGGHLWVGHHREIIAEIAAFLKAQPPDRGRHPSSGRT
jgi:pimeloyl-ACP methyl ester carboxylesterase